MNSKLFPTFSSIRFSIYDFMWRILIHLDLCFVQGEKYVSICILLHTDHQVGQHDLLKMLSFLQFVFSGTLVKYQMTSMRYTHVWTLC